MTISVWRFSHLMLALISSIFIVLASLTGMVLAFEPISNQLQDYKVESMDEVSLATTILNLANTYDEVLHVEVDNNEFVIASVLTNEGESETFYVNPETGEKLGDIIEKASVFKFATNLHRSLFLKSTGRFIIGLVSFFLFLMAITGIILIAKRQGGITRWFSKVVNENFEQYYHVLLGRYLLIPISIVAFTGVYLSLEKFDLLPESDIKHSYPEVVEVDVVRTPISEFELFRSLKISEVKSIEFPFSEDIEDYFFIKLADKELLFNQYSGDIVSEQPYAMVQMASQWSFVLHTGSGTIVWSVVLFLVCIGLLFFIYTGFAMTLKRLKNNEKVSNSIMKDDAEYIILVGSETGTTYTFATLFFKALITAGEKAFISDLNSYTGYDNAKQLIIFTATYGEGEAPTNAKQFGKHLDVTVQNKLEYAVLGFGSLMYPEYCKYAIVVDALLQQHKEFTPKLPLFKINNQSQEAFKLWVRQWSESNAIALDVKFRDSIKDQKSSKSFKVMERSALNVDRSFLIRFKPQQRVKFESGDLLSIKINSDETARLYSIGKLNGDILLSVKTHDKGLCSNYLNDINANDMIKAGIQRNYDFHFPEYADEVVMIANGTGIAPFLGMISDNKKKKKIHLFWGGRTKASFDMYDKVIYQAFDKKYISSINIAYSQEQDEQNYVQDLIAQKDEFIANHLKNEGVIMICGSLEMQNSVLETLQNITNTRLKMSLSAFENMEQIKMDCY
ncbi:PepSY domain-containing protein [Psychroserpens burtonensis]|uniref:PepSY domain-containing protein n=1 Tax=Psychroserpens burtonensis TaxID=49278 RepID=UPI00040E43EE|nr:PepSY domain-containing protein [Psychroserpens burtonensis]